MNIIHLIEKIPFLEIELIEKIGLPYMVLLYLVDVFCIYRMCRRFKEPVWTSFMPFYNRIVVFRHCWNLQAFYQHLRIEITGLVLPFVIEHFFARGIMLVILTAVDLYVAYLGVRHAIEIGEFTLKSFGYDVHRYFWSIFFFHGVLILADVGKHRGNMSH